MPNRHFKALRGIGHPSLLPAASRQNLVVAVWVALALVPVFGEGVGVQGFPVTASWIASELDLMARIAGFKLRRRVSSWAGDSFDARSGVGISVYELREGDPAYMSALRAGESRARRAVEALLLTRNPHRTRATRRCLLRYEYAHGVLTHARFRWLAVARTTGFMGNAVAPIALSFAVLDLTGSVTDLGIVVGARSIANVALLLAGGVLADRLPRALLLQGSSLAAAGTAALMAVMVLTGLASVPLLAGIGVINGAVAAVALPASYSITPETVPADLLQQANALLRIGTNTAAITGASLGGLLTATAGPGWAMLAIAAIFAIEAACYRRIGGTRGSRPRAHPLTELREGWAEFLSRRWVWAVGAAVHDRERRNGRRSAGARSRGGRGDVRARSVGFRAGEPDSRRDGRRTHRGALAAPTRAARRRGARGHGGAAPARARSSSTLGGAGPGHVPVRHSDGAVHDRVGRVATGERARREACACVQLRHDRFVCRGACRTARGRPGRRSGRLNRDTHRLRGADRGSDVGCAG